MYSQVVKENQILHKADRLIDIDDESATLADANIFAGDQIIVRDSEIHENRDIAGKLFGSHHNGGRITLCYSHRRYEVHVIFYIPLSKY